MCGHAFLRGSLLYLFPALRLFLRHLLMPPLLFMALRFLLAGLVLALVGWRQLLRLSADQYQRSARVGLVFGLAMSFWIMGLHFGTHVGEGAFLTSLGVVLVPVMARLVFKEKPPASLPATLDKTLTAAMPSCCWAEASATGGR